MVDTLIKGNKYWFFTSSDHKNLKSGILTGDFKADGSAILKTDEGVRWIVPVEKLFIKQ